MAKKATAASPFTVSNEIICGQLGRGIGLPIPPGFVIQHDEAPSHVSLDFNLASDDLPPADPAAVVAAQPELSVGIVLFDEWVVNTDRNNTNFALDQTTGQVNLFDHSHAFLGSGQDGRSLLEQHRNKSVLPGHCLAAHLTSRDSFEKWRSRISAVPEYWIEEAVLDASHVGLPPADVDFCIAYLVERRSKLSDLIALARSAFPKIQDDLWNAA